VTEIRVGVAGIGFMGGTHLRAYQRAAALGRPCRLVAVADPDPARRRGAAGAAGNIGEASTEPLFDPDAVRGHQTAEELVGDPEVDLVSLCTHTDTHADLAIRALEAGKHVIVEKPVALSSAEAARVRDAARRTGRICLPAMCMRHWPAWAWIKARIDDGSLGPVRSATFHRLGSRPAWSPDFYANESRSGGALVDLHIHDTDFICHCFGTPAAVSSAGSPMHLTTLYRFENGPAHVTAEGAWDHDPAFGFHIRCVVVFNDATADFELGRDPELRLCRNGQATPIDLPAATGYEMLIDHALDVVAGRVAPLATIDDAVNVLRVIEAERRSLETRAPVEP